VTRDVDAGHTHLKNIGGRQWYLCKGNRPLKKSPTKMGEEREEDAIQRRSLVYRLKKKSIAKKTAGREMNHVQKGKRKDKTKSSQRGKKRISIKAFVEGILGSWKQFSEHSGRVLPSSRGYDVYSLWREGVE